MNKISVKKLFDHLDFGLRKRVPLIHQTESSECSIACLAMICGYYGKNIDLVTLRQKFSLSVRGTKLSELISIAEQLRLSTRPLSLDIDELSGLKIPCILHWEFNHFVVLVSVKSNRVTINDPAIGNRTISLTEFSKSFTGVALEVWPSSSFNAKTERRLLSIGTLIGSIHGLKWTLGKIFFLSLVVESINLMLPVGTQLVMDHVIPAGDRGLLSLICICLMLLVLVRTFVSIVRSWASLMMTTFINIQWQSGLFNQLLKLPLRFFERRRLGDIQSRFGSLNTLQEAFTNSIIGSLMDSIIVFGLLIMMLLYGGYLAAIVLGFTAVYVVIRLLTYEKYRQLSEEALVRDARTKSYFMETLYGIATVKMQRLTERRGTQWVNLEVDTVNTEIKITKMDFFFGGVNSLIGTCEQIIILWLGISLVIDNQMTIGMFVAFGSFREQFSGRVFSLTNYILQFRMMSLHNERVSDIALHPCEPRKPTMSSPSNIKPISLETINLCYRYDAQTSHVFHDFTIHILAGESIAITGHSGSGKTTLMKVLCGLFEPESGQVLIDGVDIQKLGINNYQKMIGCVMQDDKLFSGTIRENICGFDECEDESLMIECAEASYIHDVISKMPMGYETLIGELGEGLSGGQKQRIFIARALYRKPGIIFMDEATSSLDVESEHYVNKAMKKLNITKIIIAHRESTIASADRVISLC